MSRELMPYFVSHGLLAAFAGWWIAGATPMMVAWTLGLFGLFVLYAVSGWFVVDLSKPLHPLSRDERAREAQRRALIASFIVGLLILAAPAWLPATAPAFLSSPGLPLQAGVVTYFLSQGFFLSRFSPIAAA